MPRQTVRILRAQLELEFDYGVSQWPFPPVYLVDSTPGGMYMGIIVVPFVLSHTCLWEPGLSSKLVVRYLYIKLSKLKLLT